MSDRAATAPNHHFDTLDQQKSAANLGVWAFLLTEVMMFGGLFMAFALYRTLNPEGFEAASQLLDVGLGTFNTVVLIGSSLTVAMAVFSAQKGNSKGIVVYFLLTIALALVFLGVKVVEYSHKLHEHHFPGASFHFEPEGLADAAQLFFCFYFFMTGFHALHMIAGITVIGFITWQAHRGRFSADYYNPVEGVGLYWHFVDIVWIYLFPLLYLVG